MQNNIHVPVLLKEILEYVPTKPNQIIIDATLGDGGHSLSIYKKIDKTSTLISFEIDQDSIDFVNKEIKPFATEASNISSKNWIIKKDSYINLNQNIDFILFDFGVSMRQLKNLDRGFSHKSSKLDMRMDLSQNVKAYDLLNILSFKQLKYIFMNFGDITENHANEISKEIIKYREEFGFGNSKDSNRLNTIISRVFGANKISKYKSVIYQVLRIAVNTEFQNIKDGLNNAFKYLNKNGIIITLSYHSLEQKIIDEFINSIQKQNCQDNKSVTKETLNSLDNRKTSNNTNYELKVYPIITPSTDEIQENISSRSAKMTVICKSCKDVSKPSGDNLQRF